MSVTNTKHDLPSQSNKNEGARKWIQRAFRKPSTRQVVSDEGDNVLRRKISLKRPQTAPSPSTVPARFMIPTNVRRASPYPSRHPPVRPPRPDSDVMRDVNAWLDASMSTPSPPLMSGLSYWRARTVMSPGDSANFQHAFPIVHKSDAERPSTSHSQQMKSFCRRAMRMQVRMPTLLRTRSQRTSPQKQVNRRSSSMPLLAIPYTATKQAAPPTILKRSRSVLLPIAQPPTSKTWTETQGLLSASGYLLESSYVRCGSLGSERFGETESNMQRCINVVFGQVGDSTRPSTAAAYLSREDSMGDLSDAPTYCTGPPPPSYRSRVISVRSTSSFGCIDGLSPAQRQVTQQHAAHRYGMRKKMKRFAQTHFTLRLLEREV